MTEKETKPKRKPRAKKKQEEVGVVQPQIPLEELKRIALLSPSIEEVAFAFDISVDAAEREMNRIDVMDALEVGRGGRKLSLKRAQWKAAMAGNTAMLIWLGKQDLGQSDKGTEGEDAIEMATKITVALKEMQRRTAPKEDDKAPDAKKIKKQLSGEESIEQEAA